MVEPGRRCLEDRYELFELIAAGGMGQVWRGRDLLFGRPVAVKVLRSEYTGDPTFLARFRAEAQHAAALNHPHIACVFDYGETVADDGSGETLAYLVMELVEGEPLSTVLRREGQLDTDTTLRLLAQAGAALGEAHRVGMVHRDVKPGNLLVRTDGSVKITDFGIAWSAGSVPLTRTGQVIGTPQYLSPEQAEGRQATPASDVYALGLVGYECLTGHSAFDGDNAVTIALKQVREQPEPLPAELPSGVRALIDRTLQKDPEARLPDGAAFVAALEDAAAGRELPPPPPASATAATAVVEPAAAKRRPGGSVAQGRAASAAAQRAAAADELAHDRHVRAAPARGRHGRRVLTVLLPLLALLTGAAIAAVVLNGVLGGERAGGSPAVAADTAGQAYTLVSADFVGRPVDEVALQLSALGLTVERVQQVTADAPVGTVTAIDPAGVALRRGQTVTVSYAVAPPSYPTGKSTSPNQQTVRRGSTAAPSSAAAAKDAASATTTAKAPASTRSANAAAPGQKVSSSGSSGSSGSSAPSGSSGSGSGSGSGSSGSSSGGSSSSSASSSSSSSSDSSSGRVPDRQSDRDSTGG